MRARPSFLVPLSPPHASCNRPLRGCRSSSTCSHLFLYTISLSTSASSVLTTIVSFCSCSSSTKHIYSDNPSRCCIDPIFSDSIVRRRS
ncbi:hypothetical protein HBI67_022250 [Parastagonospora nodorum]|nr:hypothetical protein HBI67_022250 [Parastagonospora nodorum]